MDVTGKTVTAGSMLNGVTALKNDGTDVTGNIANMTLPTAATSSSSGTSQGTITPTSSAQYLNIPTGYNSAAAYYTIAAASGGASNIVTGTFTGTTTGAVMEIPVTYTGTGDAIAFLIYPTEGLDNPNGTFRQTIQRYAVLSYFAVRNILPVIYDSGTVTTRYKSSATNAGTYSNSTSNGGSPFASAYPEATATFVATFSKPVNTWLLRVYIASNSYGFMANIPYTYHIIYSS